MSCAKLARITTALVMALLSAPACQTDGGKPEAAGYAAARERMVAEQLASRDIGDRQVLDAMRAVPRHLFVPEEYRFASYRDHPLPIGEGQTISQPYIVALMTQLLHLDGSERILEIGTGSGYQAAVLAELVDSVHTVEIVEPLARRAGALLDSLGYDKVVVRVGDGYLGWPEEAPFDGIIVTCAPPEVPEPLLDQLADQGRLVIPVGENWQELVVIVRDGDRYRRSAVLPVRFVPMTGDGIGGRQDDSTK